MGGRTETRVEEESNSYVRVEELSYEDTLRLAGTSGDAGTLAPTAVGKSFGFTNTQQSQGLLGDTLRTLGQIPAFAIGSELFSGKANLGSVAFAASFGLFGKSRWQTAGQEVDDSGWQYVDDWLATKWDRARYAIAIAELGIFSSTYSDAGEVVSVPFSAPGPVRKISLVADVLIPRKFLEVDPLKHWVEFSVSVDDGASWTRLAPSSLQPAANAKIPVLININSQVPVPERSHTQGYIDVDGEPRSCRCKIRLVRPSEQDFARYTPVVRSYRLRLSVGRDVI